MPYITTESVATKRVELKKAFPAFKMSITREHSSKIRIAIMEGKIDLLPGKDKKYEQVNEFWIKKHYGDQPEVMQVLQGIYEIANAGNGVTCVDGDYGSIPKFYVDIQIGKWDSPYVVKA